MLFLGFGMSLILFSVYVLGMLTGQVKIVRIGWMKINED